MDVRQLFHCAAVVAAVPAVPASTAAQCCTELGAVLYHLFLNVFLIFSLQQSLDLTSLIRLCCVVGSFQHPHDSTASLFNFQG